MARGAGPAATLPGTGCDRQASKCPPNTIQTFWLLQLAWRGFASHGPKPGGLELRRPVCVPCRHALVDDRCSLYLSNTMPVASPLTEAPLRAANVAPDTSSVKRAWPLCRARRDWMNSCRPCWGNVTCMLQHLVNCRAVVSCVARSSARLPDRPTRRSSTSALCPLGSRSERIVNTAVVSSPSTLARQRRLREGLVESDALLVAGESYKHQPVFSAPLANLRDFFITAHVHGSPFNGTSRGHVAATHAFQRSAMAAMSRSLVAGVYFAAQDQHS